MTVTSIKKAEEWWGDGRLGELGHSCTAGKSDGVSTDGEFRHCHHGCRDEARNVSVEKNDHLQVRSSSHSANITSHLFFFRLLEVSHFVPLGPSTPLANSVNYVA